MIQSAYGKMCIRDSSGSVADMSRFGKFVVDKHSSGGVGDKTTLIIAPIIASLGCKIPKMSGRGLGHTGGTLDKLESIPGFKTALTVEEFENTVNDCGMVVASQTEDITPADKKIYALRDTTATVSSIPDVYKRQVWDSVLEGSGRAGERE